MYGRGFESLLLHSIVKSNQMSTSTVQQRIEEVESDLEKMRTRRKLLSDQYDTTGWNRSELEEYHLQPHQIELMYAELKGLKLHWT